MRILAFAAALAILPLGGCISVPPLPPAASAPPFDALAFFADRTEGTGRMTKLFSGTKATQVQSVGRVEGTTLVLDQTLGDGSGPPTHRQWRVHETAPGRFAGTLSDAPGTIVGEVEGNRLHFTFKTRGDLVVDQRLTLASNRRSARNIMVVTKFGVRVAVLDEVIRKVD